MPEMSLSVPPALSTVVNPRIDASNRLIVALDVPTVEEARQIVNELGDAISFYKIGLHLQWDDDITDFIQNLIDSEKEVFIDYKYSDIGETMKGGVAGATKRGIKFLTIQGNGEVTEQGMRAAVAGKGGAEYPKIFCVTVLTSLDDSDLQQIGFQTSVQNLAVARAQMAAKAGLDGVIASGREALAIRKATEESFLIITPGIRSEGAFRDDHKRSCTPTEAIANCADYLVVGRPIIRQQDRNAAARLIISEMQKAFDLRVS
jgi:orotidine-5'-phosphate decarboxylase